MLKKVVGILIVLALLFFSTEATLAQDEQRRFNIDADVIYEIKEDAATSVTHNLTIENRFSDLYATSYTLTLENIEPENVQASQNGEGLPVSVNKKGGTFLIQIDFEDEVVGKGNSRSFTVTYQDDSFATRTGEVWEISIPRLSDKDSFRNYSVTLKTPVTFGDEAYMSPEPASKNTQADFNLYTFGKEAVSEFGISAGFGQFQVFSFTLNYHLENPLNRSAKVDIALPPDTAFQKMYYQILDPHPDDVYIDEDGNWLASYILDPRERVDVKATGSVQIYSSPRDFASPSAQTLDNNLSSSEFWQTSDPAISSLASQLQTPQAIYNYVTSTLSYDYERVRPNVTRMGAKKALETPGQAICMEYTDLFIAIARAAGIPAREINGYAYTENPEIQPLSLVADVLHAWPEYWDQERDVWVPIDPTWGSTTGGVDYFNKLDLRHFTFVIHGDNPNRPYPPGSYKLGPNPQKDVFVNFGQLPQDRKTSPKITAEMQNTIPLYGQKLVVRIENPGPSALYDLSVNTYFDGDLEETKTIDRLPPYANEEFNLKVPFSFFGTNTPENVKVEAESSSIDVPTRKSQVIIYSLTAFLLVLFFIILMLFIRLRGIKLKTVKENVSGIFSRHAKETSKEEAQKGNG